MTTRSVLYASDSYRATLDAAEDRAQTVIAFDFWTPHPSLEAEAPGTAFFLKAGYNVVGIKTARNDWYQGLEMEAVCRAVLAGTPGHRRIGYGGSMGGYAAINFAADLALELVIAVCPQFSINPMNAPFEWRWPAEARTIAFHQDKIGQPGQNSRARGYLVYDPCTVDEQHAERILAFHDLLPVRIRHGGHDQMLMLQQCDMLSSMLLDMIGGRFDLEACLATLRRRRRGSTVFWLNLAIVLAHHGRREAWHRALLAARTLPDAQTESFRWRFHAALRECLAEGVHRPLRESTASSGS